MTYTSDIVECFRLAVAGAGSTPAWMFLLALLAMAVLFALIGNYLLTNSMNSKGGSMAISTLTVASYFQASSSFFVGLAVNGTSSGFDPLT